MIPVAIIGAGVAGLACASKLSQAGVRSVVFDKGRCVGGRVATRRADGLQCDHGAQYVTAKGDSFVAMLRGFATTGDVGNWDDGTGKPKIVGLPGMSGLARAMASGLDIRQNAHVHSVVPAEGGWFLRIGDTELQAARVVMTVPAPQVAGLLGTDHPMVGMLGHVRLDPCLTLMAAVRGPTPFVTRTDPADSLAWIAQDSSKPGRPVADAVAWVAQAGLGFSAAHLEKDPAEIAALMLPLLCDRLGVSTDAVQYAAAHRWRYARVAEPLGKPFLCHQDATLYLGGDWCIGPRVEAAWTSGTAIADDLLAHP